LGRGDRGSGFFSVLCMARRKRSYSDTWNWWVCAENSASYRISASYRSTPQGPSYQLPLRLPFAYGADDFPLLKLNRNAILASKPPESGECPIRQ
jgi:hypothetical protein